MYRLHLKIIKQAICAKSTYDFDIILHTIDNHLVSRLHRELSLNARANSYLSLFCTVNAGIRMTSDRYLFSLICFVYRSSKILYLYYITSHTRHVCIIITPRSHLTGFLCMLQSSMNILDATSVSLDHLTVSKLVFTR